MDFLSVPACIKDQRCWSKIQDSLDCSFWERKIRFDNNRLIVHSTTLGEDDDNICSSDEFDQDGTRATGVLGVFAKQRTVADRLDGYGIFHY